jgi:hypothetical protein
MYIIVYNTTVFSQLTRVTVALTVFSLGVTVALTVFSQLTRVQFLKISFVLLKSPDKIW